MDNAVVALGTKGVKVAVAAGNSITNAKNSSPARANGLNIYTVSAIDSNDRFASFSNYGMPPVDFVVPGVGVLSTVPGGYVTYSGISMDSSHVAGLLFLGDISTDGVAYRDPDGNPDPMAIAGN